MWKTAFTKFEGASSALGRPYPLKLFKGCLSQILLGPFFNTLSHITYHFWDCCIMDNLSDICFHKNIFLMWNLKGVICMKFGFSSYAQILRIWLSISYSNAYQLFDHCQDWVTLYRIDYTMYTIPDRFSNQYENLSNCSEKHSFSVTSLANLGQKHLTW